MMVTDSATHLDRRSGHDEALLQQSDPTRKQGFGPSVIISFFVIMCVSILTVLTVFWMEVVGEEKSPVTYEKLIGRTVQAPDGLQGMIVAITWPAGSANHRPSHLAIVTVLKPQPQQFTYQLDSLLFVPQE